MKAGRNDPCPCGSGKKYKKCCLGKDQAAAERPANPAAVLLSSGETNLVPALPPRQQPAPRPKPPPRPPPDPRLERFRGALAGVRVAGRAGRLAVFLKTLDDPELMVDEQRLRDAERPAAGRIKAGERSRFAELVETLRQRRPEVFEESARYYLSWLMQDAVADGRPDLVLGRRRWNWPRRPGATSTSSTDAWTCWPITASWRPDRGACASPGPRCKPRPDLLPSAIARVGRHGGRLRDLRLPRTDRLPRPGGPHSDRPHQVLRQGPGPGLRQPLHRRRDRPGRAGVDGGRLRPEAAAEAIPARLDDDEEEEAPAPDEGAQPVAG